MFKRILVVCIGNICRSPMAEALLARELSPHAEVASAGLGALIGEPADPLARAEMDRLGIDVGAHRARQATSTDIRHADLVLVMDAEQKRAVEAMVPAARGKVFRLGQWGDFDVPDPYRQSPEVFAHVARLIQQGVAEWCSKLKA